MLNTDMFWYWFQFRQEMVHTANHGHLLGPGVSVIQKINLYEFAALGRDLEFVDRFREGPYYRGFFRGRV